MNDRDPFELLAAANPVPQLSERLPGDDEMLAAIMAMPVAPAEPKRRPRRRTIWIGAGVAVASLGLAAFAFIREESAKNPLSVVCYSTPQMNPPLQVAMPMSEDPVAACGEQWTNGAIASFGSPPVLTACVNDGGLVAVIPGNQQVCANLGLASWVGELTDEERNLMAFQEELVVVFLDHCVVQADADRTLRELMAEYGLADWQIAHRGGYSPTRQCATAGAVPETKTVVVATRRGTPTNP